MISVKPEDINGDYYAKKMEPHNSKLKQTARFFLGDEIRKRDGSGVRSGFLWDTRSVFWIHVGSMLPKNRRETM